MLDRLITIALSVAVSVLAVLWFEGRTVDAREGLLDVDRLIVRGELIVSDTGEAWEDGFEAQMIPRGLYARAGSGRNAGLWVRGRLIKCEVDDPFDDRFHSINSDGTMFRSPGHISWNVYRGDAWRQMVIITGEGLEPSEMPEELWDGANHPGQLRIQTFRPHHEEPLTDVLIGQGRASIGGGGYGGGGLPAASDVLHLWGGALVQQEVGPPERPTVAAQTGGAAHTYTVVSVGPQGRRSAPSPTAVSKGRATLEWDSAPGADAYVVQRDGVDVSGILRIEGARKRWADAPAP